MPTKYWRAFRELRKRLSLDDSGFCLIPLHQRILELRPFDLWLYLYYRRACDDGRLACAETIRETEERARIGHATVTKSRDILENCGLIATTRSLPDSRTGARITVELLDGWLEESLKDLLRRNDLPLSLIEE